jgi:large-conductance mechanosensitive channel
VLIITALMIVFTDVTDNANLKINTSYAVLFLIFLNVLVNFILVIVHAIFRLVKAFRKWRANRKKTNINPAESSRCDDSQR